MRLPQLIFLAWAFMTGFSAVKAGDQTNETSTPVSRVEATYQAARSKHLAQPTNVTVAWQFGSACFDECDFAQNNEDRARVANEGIAACREALEVDPKLAPTHYYLGMDLAQLARTKLIGALSLLGEIEGEWQTAAKLDENFDYGGPDRNLGTLYLNAPGWPISLGSRANARQHLQRAEQLHPEYPENHLNLLEAYLQWNDHADSKAEVQALTKMLPEARKKFTGLAWESNWEDWNKRWEKLQKELSKAEEPVGSPRSKR
jgi:tetratricopeptide (TPR) repeat protein